MSKHDEHIHVEVLPHPNEHFSEYSIQLKASYPVADHLLEHGNNIETYIVEKLLRELAGITNRAKVEDAWIYEGTGFSRHKRRPDEQRVRKSLFTAHEFADTSPSPIWGYRTGPALLVDDVPGTGKIPDWQREILDKWATNERIVVSTPRQHGRSAALKTFRDFYEQCFTAEQETGKMGNYLVLSTYGDGSTRITKVRAENRTKAIERAARLLGGAGSIKGIAGDPSPSYSTSFEAVRVTEPRRYDVEFTGQRAT